MTNGKDYSFYVFIQLSLMESSSLSIGQCLTLGYEVHPVVTNEHELMNCFFFQNCRQGVFTLKWFALKAENCQAIKALSVVNGHKHAWPFRLE